VPAANPQDRLAIAKLAALESWAKTPDRSRRTRPARQALLAKIEAAVDPDGVMDPATKAKAVDNARSAHFRRMALLSAQARRRETRPEP
jgi:hypothetical protein